MPFEVVRNDLTKMQVDAIVNAANHRAVVGYGVDEAVHRAAGPELLEARKAIGAVDFGSVAVTPAFELAAKWVLHAVCPVWQDGTQGEEALLAQCYRKALLMADELKCESIAFPLLAAGNLGFPRERAFQIAMSEMSQFLLAHDMQVYLVVFDRDSLALSEKLFKDVVSYIDEHYVCEALTEEFRLDTSADWYEVANRMAQTKALLAENRCLETFMVDGAIVEHYVDDMVVPPHGAMPDWQEMLNTLDAGFSETLLALIDETGKKDSEIYRKANVDRKLFSKIRNNRAYRPSKSTALAFALALELDLDATLDLIGRAGYTLSHSSMTDVVVEYFIENKNYDIIELNNVLFKLDLSLIGS